MFRMCRRSFKSEERVTVKPGRAQTGPSCSVCGDRELRNHEELLPAVRERLHASSALQTRVRLVGRVPHHAMAAFDSAADVFVLGSHHEGSGYALLEACACGVTPVVTDIPAFRVMTAGGTLGALWAPGDAHAFARALVETWESDLRATRARMAEHFDRELSWPAIGRQAMAIYGEVVTRRRAGLAGRPSC